MPRRSSSGGISAARAPPRPAPTRNLPSQPVNHAPPPAPVQSSSDGSLLGAVTDGISFGTGSAVAHRAVDAVFGPRTIRHETVATEARASNGLGGSDACSLHSQTFQDCLNNFGSDISKCQFYLDMLTECRRNCGSMLNA